MTLAITYVVDEPAGTVPPETDGALSWWVYILECSDGSLYTGITNELDRRLKQHNAGRASRCTRVRLPVRLVYREQRASRAAALSREYAIKALSRPDKQKLVRTAQDV